MYGYISNENNLTELLLVYIKVVSNGWQQFAATKSACYASIGPELHAQSPHRKVRHGGTGL